MSMNEKMLKFIDNYDCSLFVASLVEKKTIYVNKTAMETFGVTAENCDFTKIFNASEKTLIHDLLKKVKTRTETLYYNYFVTDVHGKKLTVDVQLGYFNEEETEIFLELIPCKDHRMEMALYQVNHATRPEAILNLDETLSMVHCNEPFHAVFDSSEELRHSHFENHLVNGFLPEVKTKLIGEILHHLKDSPTYSTTVKVFTTTGEERWYLFELEKRTLDESGQEKIIAYMTNVEHEVELKSENTLLIQQLSAMQELTEDLLYHIDVKKGIFYHNVEIYRGKDAGYAISDFVNFFVAREIVHPEDAEKYQNFLKDWYSTAPTQEECTIRVSIISPEYQWYTIRGKKIYDEKGILTNVLGALVNVQKEYDIKKDYNTLNQYFDVLQTISHESFYSVDVKNKTLTQRGKVAEELGLVQETPNFPESVLYKVHPEDIEKYKNYSYSSMQGMSGQAEVRVQTKTGVFQWYRLQCEIVHDENGDIAEVVGKMNNVQKEKELDESFASLNHIFTAFQKLSDDILFRIDVNTGSMFQTGDTETALALGKEIPDYVNTLLQGAVIHPDDTENFTQFTSDILVGLQKECQVRVATTPTNYDWFQITVQPVYDDNHVILEIFGIMTNIQRKKDLERKASHDLMTSVLNKVSFEQESTEVLKESTEQTHHALIFVDLDDFKAVNDSYGHSFGDFLLTTVSKRLKRVVREHDLVGRLGGDEFSLLLKSIGSAEAAQSRVNLLLDTLNRPFSFDGKTVEIKASIGCALYPIHGSDYSELIKKADIALYCSKRKGKNAVTLYCQELETETLSKD